jgi:uncharacterized protein (TIGR02145 family)
MYKLFYLAVAFTVILASLFLACRKLDFGTVTKINIENVTIIDANTVKVALNIFDLSDDIHSEYGVCYSATNQKPTIEDINTSKGAIVSIKKDTIIIQNLQPGSKIYIRSYVMDGNIPKYSFNVKDAILPSLPTALTHAATSITAVSAKLNGIVNANGTTTTIIFEYGTSQTYGQTINANPDTVRGSVNTNVSADLTGLQANTVYHFRVKATCQNIVVFGKDTTFTTLQISVPVVTTAEVSNISQTTAKSGGNIISEGIGTITARGICWSTSQSPTISNPHTTDGTGTGVFTSNLTVLNSNTLYYVRAYATNSAGTAYGNQVSFTTLASGVLPSLTTTTVTNITQTTATSGGNITSDGGTSVTARGVCWSTSQNPTTTDSHTTDGTGTGYFVSSLTGLNNYTLYYVRAYATNSAGTAYGNQVSFTTLAAVVLPSLTTTTTTNITQTTATSGGNVSSDGGSSITARGVCWSTNQNPNITNSHTTDGAATGVFTSSLTGLTANTLYNVRAYATNSAGTAYGENISFTTLSGGSGGSVTDIDGNVYSTITIGTQEWMGENLKVKHYQNGHLIPNVPVENEWISLSYGAFCWYNNDETSYNDTYGLLYNYYTVNDIRGLCPTGWKTPSDAEWIILRDYLGGDAIAGGLLKETGTTHWQNPNTGATNETGYTALPGGIRSSGIFFEVGERGTWWSSTNVDLNNSWAFYLHNGSAGAFRGQYSMNNGFSVRCMKDSQEPLLPTVTTTSVSNITQSTATSGGNVTSDGGATVTARGVCWSTSQNPTTTGSHTTDGSGTGSFTSNLTNLNANTLYYVRAYATNSVGTSYGSQVSFTTQTASGTVTDVDGNVYTTIVIGSQEWMAENLKVTHFRNGEPIQNVTDDTQWSLSESGTYCWYNNDESTYGETYGALYNYFTVVDSRNICPTGWHIPSDTEWSILTTYLGGESVAGGKMKETGTLHWLSPNAAATNESGFTALPGGHRFFQGPFDNIGWIGSWWSSTMNDSNDAIMRSVTKQDGHVSNYYYVRSYGFSVRCLLD